ICVNVGPIGRRCKVIECAHLQKLLPLKQHGNRWRREHEGSAQGRSLLRPPAIGLGWVDLGWHTSMPVAISVVRFGIDNAGERGGDVASLEHRLYAPHVPLCVICYGERRPYLLDKIPIPLCVEASTTISGWPRDPLIVTQVFSDREFPGLRGRDVVVYFLQEEPSVSDILLRITAAGLVA